MGARGHRLCATAVGGHRITTRRRRAAADRIAARGAVAARVRRDLLPARGEPSRSRLPARRQDHGKIEERVLGRAGEQTLSEFKRSRRRAVASAAPARAEQQREQALTDRRVCLTPRDDGMSELWALLPAEGAAAVSAAVDALASAAPARRRSAYRRPAPCRRPRRPRRRRATRPTAAQGAGHAPDRPGHRRAVHLLGWDEQPGELAGHGPIPATLAHHIAADATGTWRRLITDPPTGALLDRGTTTYRPPANLTAFVIAREQTCTFAGCRRAAHRCDLDHEQPASTGRQPRCPLPPPPSRQTPSRLAGPTRSAHRRLALAQPHRSCIPLAATQLPTRPHNRPSTTAVLSCPSDRGAAAGAS